RCRRGGGARISERVWWIVYSPATLLRRGSHRWTPRPSQRRRSPMQFHHPGYVSTDPRIQPAAGVGLDRPTELPDEFDVLVVGTGPAGTITAAQLSQFPEVHTRIIDRRPHRLKIGHADGIQARSVETFQAFGFAGRLTDEAYRITEMAFWKPDP